MAYKLSNTCVRGLLTTLILNLFCPALVAQNLVKNPGFEERIRCPKEYGSLSEDALFWKQPTYGSTDYFHSCSDNMSVNHNFIGKQETFEGKAYAGLYAYGPRDYREYLAGELSKTLTKGKKYNFSFRVSLADKSEYAIKEFGILFINKVLNLHTERNIPHNLMSRSGLNNYVGLYDPKYYKDKDHWMEISGDYIADGTEKFIVLGNFKSNSETNPSKVASNLKKAAYYYVDLISVEEADKPYNLDETYVLENLLFDVNGYTVKGLGKKQLESLVLHLKDNPSLNISIYGHTDNVGSSTYNKELSQKRAKTVSLFLVNNGLSPVRIAWKGYGDIIPLAENETKEGRDKNRRVEFVISKKRPDTYASGLFEDEN